MKLRRAVFWGLAGAFFATAGLLAADVASTNNAVTSPPVQVPDTSHANGPLPDGILAWDEVLKSTSAAADQPQAHFIYSLTNVSSGNIVILSVQPSCGCTTAELPPLPWTVAPGASGQIHLTVNLQGKSGTLSKTANVSADKGSKTLMMHINILPPAVMPKMTGADRARNLAAARIDRQAVFHGDCAQCHLNNIQGKYGKPLYDSVCAPCHEAGQRAALVPDLHNLKTPTNDEDRRGWIAHGKADSLMPAFAASDGGPLTDIQITTLAVYLEAAIPTPAPVNK